jgi:signal transduction histidine kinase
MDKQHIRVLLIEDDKTYAFLIREYLTDSRFYRFELVHLDHLAPGLDRLKNERFDVALLDLGLPDSFGLETIKRFSEAASWLPVIVLSGNTDETVAMEGVSLGAQDYLLKGSFDGHALTRAIHYAIERKKIERFKEDFSSIVSHELRAPLAVIKGAVDGLRDGAIGPLNDRQKKFLDLAGKHVQRLSKIIINILDLARYESGHAVIRPERVDVADLVQETLLAYQEDASRVAVSLSTHLAEDLPCAHADPDMLSEVLNNLVGNAVRFAKSRIVISATKATASDLKDAGLDGLNAKGFIAFTVLDDGPGVPRDKIKDLFNKFVQFSRKSGDAYKGTGLGLSICKTIVQLLKGRIWAESPDGGGARFRFVVPAAP